MSFRHIVDVDNVKTCVDECGHVASQRFQNYSTSGRWPQITRPEWRSRIDDHGGQTLPQYHLLHQTFSQYLAALVGANSRLA